MISLIPWRALSRALMLQLRFRNLFSSSFGARNPRGGLPVMPSNFSRASSILDGDFLVGAFVSASVIVVSVNSGVALRIMPCKGRLSTLLAWESTRKSGLLCAQLEKWSCELTAEREDMGRGRRSGVEGGAKVTFSSGVAERKDEGVGGVVLITEAM